MVRDEDEQERRQERERLLRVHAARGDRLSAYFEEQLDKARATPVELETISVSRRAVASPAGSAAPSGPASKPSPVAEGEGESKDESEEERLSRWKPEDLAKSRPSATPSQPDPKAENGADAGRVYVRGYYRKNGKYVAGYWRRK